MEDIVKSLYNAGYSLWDTIVGIAMTLFTTSPTAAGGGVYGTAHALFLAISDISIPIAIVFFMIAIIKDVTSTPPDQQIRRFFNDAIKFGVMVGILVNLWSIMGYVIQISDGITGNLATGASYSLVIPAELEATIDAALEPPDFSIFELGPTMIDIMKWIGAFLLFLISGVVTLFVVVASAISILSCAFQRILKPLVLLPFSCITVALATGTSEAGRVTSSYIKAFFGFCISGAFMVICVNLGAALGNGLVNVDYSAMSDFGKIIFISVQNAIIPIIIAGLVKNADSIIGKFF